VQEPIKTAVFTLVAVRTSNAPQHLGYYNIDFEFVHKMNEQSRVVQLWNLVLRGHFESYSRFLILFVSVQVFCFIWSSNQFYRFMADRKIILVDIK
jgi:hypothetical protein